MGVAIRRYIEARERRHNMNGKITIDIPARGQYAFDVAINHATRMDKIMTVDALVEASNLARTNAPNWPCCLLSAGSRHYTRAL